MPDDVQAAVSNAPKPQALYERLEDRILARDQKGASERLLRSGARRAGR